MIKKLHAIVDPDFKIPFPPCDFPFAEEVIHRCLDRDPRRRLTIPQLLAHPFLSGSRATIDLASISDIVKETIRITRLGAAASPDDMAKVETGLVFSGNADI